MKEKLSRSKLSISAAMGAALCMLAALFFGCVNPLAEPPAAEPADAGHGSVTVNFAGAARTVFPALLFDNYAYSFTQSGGSAQTMTPGEDGKFTLETGEWTVEVKAYAGAAEEANLAAAGAAQFTVTHGEETAVTVLLTGVTESGSGTFKYRIQYPAAAELTGVVMEKLKLSDSDKDLAVDLGEPARTSASGVTVSAKTTSPVSAGFYLVSVRLAMNEMTAGRNDVVHIYNNLTSEFGTAESPVVFNESDFAYSGAPDAPAAPTVTAADKQLTVTWTASPKTTAYELWHGTEDSAEGAQKFGDDETGFSKTITGLVNGTAYYVWIKAKNGVGASGFSPSANGTPQAAATAPEVPAAPTATAGNQRLVVTWTAATGAAAYEVWHGTTDSAEGAQKSGDDETGFSKTITGLVNGTAYYVWLKAKNSAGTSGFSPSASGTPLAPPGVPAAPTVTAGDRQLTAAWTAAAGAAAYEVWHGTTDNTEKAGKFGNDITSGTSAVITELDNGAAYYVWIKAKNSVGTSGFSPSASGTPLAPPGVPAAPTVTAGDQQLVVTWTAAAGAAAYEVWHGTTDSAEGAQKSGDDETGVSKTITGLVNGTAYYVWVKAKNSVGTSGFSPSASGTPLAPPGVPAAPTVTAGDQQLAVTWTAATGAAAYEVWHGTTDSAEGAQKSGDDETGVSKTITGLANGTAYYVWVKAKNSVGTSGFSPSASGTPLAPPGVPAAPTVEAGDQQLAVTWTAATGAAAYEVWHGTIDNTENAAKFGNDITAGTSAVITDLDNGTAYYVWIKAKNSVGTSGFSPSASGTPILLQPEAPAAPKVTTGYRQLTVTWTAVAGAAAYEVWYGTTNNTGNAQKSGDDATDAATTITGLANDTRYYVWVKAKNSTGASGFSPSANGYPRSNDATLSLFRLVGSAKHNRQHIVPKFAAANEAYTLSVDYWVDTIQLEVTTTQANATVASSAAYAISPSGKVFTLFYNLANGDNNISIVVTAPDKVSTKNYTIVVNRDAFNGGNGSMASCTGAENVVPPWLFGFWSFVYDSNGSTEDITITTQPLMAPENLGSLEFGMGMGMPWIAGDIVYSKEFSGRSGVLIIRLNPGVGAVNPIADPTSDKKGYYAVYYFDRVGGGGLGTTARIFQSNQIGNSGGVAAYAALEKAKAAFIVDDWHSANLTTIGAVGDPQIKRPADWVWDGTVDWRED